MITARNSHTGQPYRDLPECFAGCMGRQPSASGALFEPKAVADEVDVAAPPRIGLPAAFDVVAREVI